MITPGHARAAHMDFAHRADGNELTAGIQQDQAEMRQGRADEADGTGLIGLSKRPPGDMHGGLGDAVHVHQSRTLIAMALEPGPKRCQVQSLAAEDDPAQGQVRGPGATALRNHELTKGGGGLIEHRDPALGQKLVEGVRVAGQVAGDDLQTPAQKQRTPHLPHGEIECVGVKERPDVVGTEVEKGSGRGHETGHVGVGDDAAFGTARGAAGVDEVGGVGGEDGDVGGCRGVVCKKIISNQ